MLHLCRPLLWILTGMLLPAVASANHCSSPTSGSGLNLLEPIGTFHCLDADILSGNAISVMTAYLTALLPWLLGLSAVVTVLMVAIGGVQIITALSDSAAETGKKRIWYSIGGFVLLTFAATVLQFLNYTFFIGPP